MIDMQIPSAQDYAVKLALVEAEEAEKKAKARRQAEDEKAFLIEKLTKPSGVSDEAAVQAAIRMIETAVKNRRTQVQVYRFPNRLCTDGGRAINQKEPGWEDTLSGVPKEVYLIWRKYFRDKGYGLRVEIIDYPDGMPGDVGMTLTWI